MDTKALPILLSATECSQAKSAEVPITDKTCYPPFQCHSNISFNACVFRQFPPQGWLGDGHICRDFPLGYRSENFFWKGLGSDILGFFMPHVISVTQFFISNNPLKCQITFFKDCTKHAGALIRYKGLLAPAPK